MNAQAVAKPIPYDIEAEQAVIGSMLINPDAVAQVRGILASGDFYREAHQWAYDAMLHLESRGEAIDTLTLSSELSRRGQLDAIGGPAALTEYMLHVPTALNAEYYAATVLRCSISRLVIGDAEVVAKAAYEGMEPNDLIGLAQSRLAATMKRTGGSDTTSIAEVAARVYDSIIERIEFGILPGIRTPSHQLDKLLGGGWEPKTLNIVAALQGGGKTAWMLSAMVHAAKSGVAGLVNSLEMGQDQLTARLIATEAGLDSQMLRGGPGRRMGRDEFDERLARAVDTISHLPLYFTYQPTAAGLRARVLALSSRCDLGLVGVDYLQIMQHATTRDTNRAQAIGQTSRQLKELAMETGAPVICLSQLNNEGKKGEPSMVDLRDSGVIAEDADTVLLFWQEESPDPNHPKPLNAKLEKHRDGPTGRFQLVFNRVLGTFVDAAPAYLAAQEPPPLHRKSSANGSNGYHKAKEEEVIPW